MYHTRILNRRRSVSVILHTLIGVAVCCKVQIQPDVASECTGGEIRFMYKAVNKTKVIKRYMEAIALYTGEITEHLEDNTRCISVVEAKRSNPRVKQIGIPV